MDSTRGSSLRFGKDLKAVFFHSLLLFKKDDFRTIGINYLKNDSNVKRKKGCYVLLSITISTS